jgi:hypothetical protein
VHELPKGDPRRGPARWLSESELKRSASLRKLDSESTPPGTKPSEPPTPDETSPTPSTPKDSSNPAWPRVGLVVLLFALGLRVVLRK